LYLLDRPAFSASLDEETEDDDAGKGLDDPWENGGEEKVAQL
jgi:hypothetical protein